MDLPLAAIPLLFPDLLRDLPIVVAFQKSMLWLPCEFPVAVTAFSAVHFPHVAVAFLAVHFPPIAGLF